MNTPLSFVPDQQVATPSTFVPDGQVNAPKSFVPDSSAVLNKNTTGFSLQPDQRPMPATYGDAMAMKSPMDVQSPGIGTTAGEVASAPLTILGQFAAGFVNAAAQKNLPDERSQYGAFKTAHGTDAPHLRNFFQKGLFGPSNLSVLGKDPNEEMFHQGQSVLPMEQSVVGSGSDMRKMVESMTTPEGIASVPLAFTKAGPLLSAAYGLSTAANLPEMKPADIAANAIMMGLPMAKSIHESILGNTFSHRTPTVKEGPPTLNEQNSLPKSAVGSSLPEGGDKNSVVIGENQTPVSRGTLSPAPVTFKGVQKGFGPVKDFNLYDLNEDIPGHSKGSTVGGPELEKLGYSLPEQVQAGMKGGSEAGSVGLHVLDPEIWKELGFKAKTEGQQFINRLRNKLGVESAGWKMIDTPELKSFMQEPRTTQEVQDFVNNNGPKVEVRKFSNSTEYTDQEKAIYEKAGQLRHELDTKYPTWGQEPRNGKFATDPEYVRLRSELDKTADQIDTFEDKGNKEQSHWQSIAPKSEKELPGYTEIAVVKPTSSRLKSEQEPYFPSSHSFPANTLGFVRGYMETTPQGKKVFHVIEVQSDWAQRARDQAQEQRSSTGQLIYGGKSLADPLLPHYERLALKAAIDHAREQGADSIAISDAETAMMTEGHDRQVPFRVRATPANVELAKKVKVDREARGLSNQLVDRIINGNEVEFVEGGLKARQLGFEGDYMPTQGEGMRLHYDRTLPKIAEELTGEKGTKESFGEHRMAMEPDPLGRFDGPEPINKVPRKDLVFRDSSGQPKTDVTARVYPITKAAKDFSIIGKDKPVKQVGNQGVSGESGMIDLSGARESLDKGIENLKEFFSDEGIRRKTMKMAGVSVPRTTAANEKVGNQLTMFAQAEGVAEAKARSMASEVLGSHWKDKEFDAKLGAVGVEDQLRTKKAQLLAAGKTAEAQSVNTLVGQPYSPIKSEAQYQQLKNAPEIKAALARHTATVQGLAEQKQTALKGAIRSVGQDTGSFFNLIAKGVDSGDIHKARQGNTMATLKGGTRFGKEFKGTGAEYETSYRKMAERMVKGNWTEVEKQKLFDLVDSSGFGHLQKAGEDLPTFNKLMSPIPVQRRMAVIIKPGDKPVMKSQNETLWVPKSSAEEFRQAFQTDSPLKEGLIKNISSVVTKVQTGLGADAAFHVGNMAAAVVTSPEKATAVKLMVQNLAKTFENNPAVQKKLSDMATEAGIVREGENEVAAWKKLIPGKNMISWVDQAGRLTLDQLYQDAVKRGESPNNPVWRRAAVQGALGEYNKRLMPKVQQIMKESGLSPFLTAGKTFNRLSVRQLMLSPGRKAADLQGGAKMRLKQALYTTGLVVALPMIINNAMTGHPFPQGVEPGQFVVKKNEDGSYVVEDIAQLLMMRRGLRNTGIQAVAHGIEDKQSVGQIIKQGTKDVARGIVRPFAGPTVSAADTVTGAGLLMDKPSEPINQRIKEAGQQANPTAEVLLNKDESKTSGEKFIGRFGRTIGMKVTQTRVSRINSLARDWKERNGVPLDNSPRGPYFDLTSALRKNDAQGARKALQSVGLADKKDELIKQYYDKIATKPFTDSDKHEKAFVSELGDEDKKVYQSVKDSNAQVRERFYNIFMGRPAPRLPREAREERPAREQKFLPR